jgi:transcriptional regulator GlxA family with amidase domain
MVHPASNGCGDGTRPNLSVGFVLVPEFTLGSLSGFVDALRIAADNLDGSRQIHCRWTIMGPDRRPVRSSSGVEIAPWDVFKSPAAFDYIVVVGGLLRGQERIDPRLLEYVRKANAAGVSLVGVCTGSFVLARAGVMRGRRACVHWHHVDEFRKEFPEQRVDGEQVYVVDGKIITCAGGQSATDVALYLIERHCSRSIALKVASGMVMEKARGSKDAQPRPEADWFRRIEDTLVQRAILLMEQQSPARHVMISEIAAKVGVSERTLVRAFHRCFKLSPAAFLRALRLAHGRWDVLNTRKPIGWIASDYGFSDASHFTRLFREYYCVTPAAARERGSLDRATRGREAGRGMEGVLDQILWEDPLSFAAIDWPTEDRLQRD